MLPENPIGPKRQQTNHRRVEHEDARTAFLRASSSSYIEPQVQPANQVRNHNELGRTPMGLVLEGRQPGCVLNRDLSPDTLSHILLEDNLRWLGIEKARGRKSGLPTIMDLDEGKGIDDSGVKIQVTGEEEQKSGLKSAGDEQASEKNTEPGINVDENEYNKGSELWDTWSQDILVETITLDDVQSSSMATRSKSGTRLPLALANTLVLSISVLLQTYFKFTGVLRSSYTSLSESDRWLLLNFIITLLSHKYGF